MPKQLLITMRGERAERYAADRMPPLFADLAPEAASLKLIGKPGYCMRVVIDDADEAYLRDMLAGEFIVEDDYTMRSFDAVTASAGTGDAGSTPRTAPRLAP